MAHWVDEYYGRGIGKAMGPKNLTWLIQLLRSVGMPEKLLPYMLAQIDLETDGGFSTLATLNNNWSGIRCNNHGLTSGCVDRAAPMSKANKFATYATPGKWASDYKRILSMGARPIDAQNAQDFYQRLKKNGYFTATEAGNYSTAMNSRLREVNKILADESGDLATALKQYKEGHDLDQKGKPKPPPGFAWFGEHPILTGAIAAALGLMVIKTISR